MKEYDKILYYSKIPFNNQFVYAFDKIDGSNLRFECNRKRGFYKFGTRQILIDRKDKIYGSGIDIFMEKYSESLLKKFNLPQYRNILSFVVFGELVGENSFAGQHEETDNKDVCIFDIVQYKKGFVHPKEFIKDFGDLNIPKLIYRGIVDYNFIDDIKQNKYKLKEGVVCKFVNKAGDVESFKIKTYEWIKKVKERYGEKYVLEDLDNDPNILNEIS